VRVLLFSKSNKKTVLPKKYIKAHELSYLIHDVMTEIYVSGMQGNFFTTTIDLEKNDLNNLENAENIFAWLEQENRVQDRARILKTVVLPAILSDMLHCIYEALNTSKKGKLNISYMLVRKPIQESLYVLEEIVLNELRFSENLALDPLKLRSQNAGGVQKHAERICNVLNVIDENDRFDALYIAQLRYDKTQYDSFDGVCNRAMHLFTEHNAIRTEKLNINFIFSGWEQKITQWSYLYSRLPYLLLYILRIVEYIVKSIALTTQEYLDDIERRIASSIILWSEDIDERYKNEQLNQFVRVAESWLNLHCQQYGHKMPIRKDLLHMSQTGAYPDENFFALKKRNMKYKLHALLNNLAAKN
jgi:hypothetical protein